MSIPSPTDILGYIAPISQYLASNAVSEGALFGEPVNPNLPIQIYINTQSVQYRYDYENIADGNTPSASLVGTANYLYSLCGMFGLIAMGLRQSGGAVPGTGGDTHLYSAPAQTFYIGTFDGEASFSLAIPAGSKIFQATKGVSPLIQSQWSFTYPVFTLLGGLYLAEGEMMFFLYVYPVN